ncbi:unnamed protein product [Rotaria magnacalcarata]
MGTIHKSNSKRTEKVVLTENKKIYDIGDEECDSSNSDLDQSDIATDIQPETLQKVGVTWPIHSVPVKDRISAAKKMKKKPVYVSPTLPMAELQSRFRHCTQKL